MKRILLALLTTLPLCLPANAQDDTTLSASAKTALRGASLHAVQASAQHGVLTLTGTVPVYSDKLKARADVSRIPGVTAIQDRILVAGPPVADAALQRRLENQIAFNSYQHTRELPTTPQTISVDVHNGSVTLTGQNADPLLASVALHTVENTPGVKSVTNHLHTRAVSTAANSGTAYTGTGGLSTLP